MTLVLSDLLHLAAADRAGGIGGDTVPFLSGGLGASSSQMTSKNSVRHKPMQILTYLLSA